MPNLQTAHRTAYALLVHFSLSALPVFAQATNPGPAGSPSGQGGNAAVETSLLDKGLDGVRLLSCKVFSWVYTFAIIVGVIFIILAAIQYMTAGENSEQVKKAHASLRNAMIGIGVAIIAWGVPNIIASFLEVKGTNFDNAC